MLHYVPASVEKDYSVAALLSLRSAMKANKRRSKIAHEWMSRGNLEIGSSQIDIVCAQGKWIPVLDSCVMCICCFMLWLTHTNTKTLFPPHSGPFPEKRAVIMRKSPSPPIRKQSQNWGNQIRFNKVIIYNWVPLKKKLPATPVQESTEPGSILETLTSFLSSRRAP